MLQVEPDHRLRAIMKPMIRTWAALTLSLTLALWLIASPLAAQTENPADVATARELFREGLQLSRDGEWERAHTKLEQSLALKKAAITYYTLAVADKRSGHPAAALEHFKGFLAQPITPTTEAYVEPAKQAVEELSRVVARVVVSIEPTGLPDLTVHLDGVELPTVALGRSRLIEAGRHTVVARAPG